MKGPTVVAVKTLVHNAGPKHQALFAEEFRVMVKAGHHINIVNLLGITLQGWWDFLSKRSFILVRPNRKLIEVVRWDANEFILMVRKTRFIDEFDFNDFLKQI